jgi:hypothetical protein
MAVSLDAPRKHAAGAHDSTYAHAMVTIPCICCWYGIVLGQQETCTMAYTSGGSRRKHNGPIMRTIQGQQCVVVWRAYLLGSV